MTWQPCPRCSDLNRWADDFCTTCGAQMRVTVRKPPKDPPKAAATKFASPPCRWCGETFCAEHADLDGLLEASWWVDSYALPRPEKR